MRNRPVNDLLAIVACRVRVLIRMTGSRLAGVWLLAFLASMAGAEVTEPVEPEPDVLTAEAVMLSAREQFPQVLQALANVEGARGRAQASLGAFDLVFKADGFARTSGFYDGLSLGAKATQPIAPWGAEVYSGYKISNGTFPIYEDVNFTNTGGTPQLGVLFSLLKDRTIDDRRFGIIDAELAVRQSELELLLTRVGVQQRALAAYWQWVVAGRQLQVFEELLRLALTREVGLERQVERGARARIFLTENQQNITRRRILVTTAQQEYELAANGLSFYWRDENGAPRHPTLKQLPSEVPTAELEHLNEIGIASSRAAVAVRPELRALRVSAERARRRIELKQNDLKPTLDLTLERQRGFGAIAEGGRSRDTVDTVIGLTFDVPLQRRRARGELSAEQARLQAIDEEARLVEDQIELEISNLLVRLNVARDLLDLALQDVSLSDAMREAEVKRFENGASDFFLVNLREETAFNARVRYLQAAFDLRLARVIYDAATVDLPRLGLGQ